MENLLFLGVPILKHIRVNYNDSNCWDSNVGENNKRRSRSLILFVMPPASLDSMEALEKSLTSEVPLSNFLLLISFF